MKLNDIKFLPKANAFSDVYAKATGMPFVGELMAAAAGNGGGNDDYGPVKLAPNSLIEVLGQIYSEIQNIFFAGNPTYEEGEGLFIGVYTDTFFYENYSATLTVDGNTYTDIMLYYAIEEISGTSTEYDGMSFEVFIVPDVTLSIGNNKFTLVFNVDGVESKISGEISKQEPFALSNITVRNYVDEYEFPHTVVEADGNIDPSVQDASMKQISMFNSNPINPNDSWGATLTQVINDPLKWSGNYIRYPDSQDVTQQSGECQITYMWDTTGSLPTTGTWTLVE